MILWATKQFFFLQRELLYISDSASKRATLENKGGALNEALRGLEKIRGSKRLGALFWYPFAFLEKYFAKQPDKKEIACKRGAHQNDFGVCLEVQICTWNST